MVGFTHKITVVKFTGHSIMELQQLPIMYHPSTILTVNSTSGIILERHFKMRACSVSVRYIKQLTASLVL